MEACTNTPRNTRIAVFYDGSYFCNVSDYYRLSHSRASNLCHNGLHGFIKNKVAQFQNTDALNCTIVDAHYFRGRFSLADSAKHAAGLFRDRKHDEALMDANITSHYLPLFHKAGAEDCYVEKGIDVWFALEAYELTLLKKYDVVVLITGDADHLPLMRKLTALNSRVMLLYWNIDLPSWSDIKGAFTSKAIVKASTYAVNMVEEINQGKGNPVVENMFAKKTSDIIEQKLTNKKKEKKNFQETRPTYNVTPVNVEMRKQILNTSKAIEKKKNNNGVYTIELKPEIKSGKHQVKKANNEKVKSSENELKNTKAVENKHPVPPTNIIANLEVHTNLPIEDKPTLIAEKLEQNRSVSRALENEVDARANNTAVCLYKVTCTALIHIPAAKTSTGEVPQVKKRLKNLTGRQKGVITWIDYHRGIGKVDISSDYPPITFYCNANNIHKFKGLKKNNLVEFDLKKSPNGTFAVNLKSAAA